MSNEITPNRLMTRAELAELLGLSAKTLRRMELSGKLLPPVRIGRNVRWRYGETCRWIEADCPPAREWNLRKDA